MLFCIACAFHSPWRRCFVARDCSCGCTGMRRHSLQWCTGTACARTQAAGCSVGAQLSCRHSTMRADHLHSAWWLPLACRLLCFMHRHFTHGVTVQDGDVSRCRCEPTMAFPVSGFIWSVASGPDRHGHPAWPQSGELFGPSRRPSKLNRLCSDRTVFEVFCAFPSHTPSLVGREEGGLVCQGGPQWGPSLRRW